MCVRRADGFGGGSNITYNFLINTCRWGLRAGWQRFGSEAAVVGACISSQWLCCAALSVFRLLWVRESGDHGPFNSWDRQVYVTDVRTGQPDVIKEWDDISHNFFIANYNSQEAIDNDDGSWCVFGGGWSRCTVVLMFVYFVVMTCVVFFVMGCIPCVFCLWCTSYYHSHHNVMSYSGNGMKVRGCY